ncbi:MAG TPA: transposase [Gemmatimonadales bacterium]|nr:transposase [Gemmatimonadales bacterium]
MPSLLRLKGFHYGAGAGYFITFCTYRRRQVLSSVAFGEAVPTPLGRLVLQGWGELPARYGGVYLDEFVLMPDHVHGILIFGEAATTTLLKVVCRLKGLTTIQARRTGFWGTSPLWQKSFHDRVIRNDRELQLIREYVRNNPNRWVR